MLLKGNIAVILLYVGLASLALARGARVLLVPWPFSSHVSEFVNIGEGLADSGHEVYSLTTPSFPDIAKFESEKVKFIAYQMADPDFFMTYDDKKMAEFTDYLTEISLKTDFRTSIEGYQEMCTNPLKDQDLYKRLKGMKFDIAVVDVFPMARCTLVLMHRLGLPYVVMETVDEPWLLRNPALPSAWPTNIASTPHSEAMGFLERLDNLWAVIDWAAFTGICYMEDDFLKEFFYETEPVPLSQLAGKAVLWLLEYNQVLDYPRPKMANEVHVGGLTTKPAKPLPDDLEKFMSSNPNGVVIVAFGSLASYLPQRAVQALLDSFKLVKYNVIMRYPMALPDDVPKHVRLDSWLPQNDLLGHNNTKLFITHCGANGQNEALYHGVPMIGLPVFAEQPHNAKRLVYHGFGQALNFKTFTAEELANAINEVIADPTYSENIALASAIFHDQPMTPRQTALYWIEHVIKHGGAHMRPHALDMPWYQYLMLDILAFIFTVFFICVVALLCVIKKVLSIIKANGHKTKVE